MSESSQPAQVGSNAGLGLVERLRQQFPDVPYHRDQLHRDAADEIERLRAALEEIAAKDVTGYGRTALGDVARRALKADKEGL